MIKDLSINQERASIDEKIGDAMRQGQQARELKEEYSKLYVRIHNTEPETPLGGIAQRSVLDFIEKCKLQAIKKTEQNHQEVTRLRLLRP